MSIKGESKKEIDYTDEENTAVEAKVRKDIQEMKEKDAALEDEKNVDELRHLASRASNSTLYCVLFTILYRQKGVDFLSKKFEEMTPKDLFDVASSMVQHTGLASRDGGRLGSLDLEQANMLIGKIQTLTVFEWLFSRRATVETVVPDLALPPMLARCYGAVSTLNTVYFRGVEYTIKKGRFIPENVEAVLGALKEVTGRTYKCITTDDETIAAVDLFCLCSRVTISPEKTLAVRFVEDTERMFLNAGIIESFNEIRTYCARLNGRIDGSTLPEGITRNSLIYQVIVAFCSMEDKVKKQFVDYASKIRAKILEKLKPQKDLVESVIRKARSEYAKMNDPRFPVTSPGVIELRKAGKSFRNTSVVRRSIADLGGFRFLQTHGKWVKVLTQMKAGLATGKRELQKSKVDAFGVGDRHWQGAIDAFCDPQKVTFFDIKAREGVVYQDITKLPEGFGNGKILLDDTHLIGVQMKGGYFNDQMPKLDPILKANYDTVAIKWHFNQSCTLDLPEFMVKIAQKYLHVRVVESTRPHSTEFFILASNQMEEYKPNSWWTAFVISKAQRIACGENLRQLNTLGFFDAELEERVFGDKLMYNMKDLLAAAPYKGQTQYITLSLIHI